MAKFASRLVTENVDWKIRFHLGRQFHEKERLTWKAFPDLVMETTPYVRLWNFFTPETRWNENRHDNKSIIRAMPLTWPPLRRRIQGATAWTVKANTTHSIIRRNIRWYFRIYISVQNVFLIHRFLVRVYLKVGQNFHLDADDNPKKPKRRCGREPCIAGLISVEVNELAWRSLAFF